MTGTTQTELLVIVFSYFLFLWSLHTFLDDYLHWKPRVFFDANGEDWSEYRYRATHSLMPKSNPNYEPNVRVQKSASLRVLFVVSKSLFMCMFVYSLSFATDNWRRVLVANTDFDKWRLLEITAAMIFVLYTYDMSATTRNPLSLTVAAHHITTSVACVMIMCGDYFPIAIWYGMCTVALQCPQDIGRVLFFRYAERYPTLTRRVLKFTTGWYLVTGCLLNICGALTIAVAHARRGHWQRFVVSVICVLVWANDDRLLLRWLWDVSQIEYIAKDP